MHVEELQSVSQLEGLDLPWRKLWLQTPGGTYFQSLDWIRLLDRHYGDQLNWRILVASTGQEIQGILPLVVEERRTKLGALRVLTYPLRYWGTFFGPVGPQPAATLAVCLQHIARTKRSWHLLDMDWIPTAGLFARTKSAMQLAGLQPVTGRSQPVRYVDLAPTAEEFWSRGRGKFRRDLNRARRRALQHAQLEHVRYRPNGSAAGDDDPRWDLYEECLDVANRSWQGHSYTGNTLNHESVKAFLKDLHASAVKAGAADLNLLRWDGRPVAFAYNLCHHGELFGLRLGYDSAMGNFQVGHLLMQSLVDDSHRRGDVCINMGEGDSPWKTKWQTRVEDRTRLVHYAGTFKAQLLRLKHVISQRNEKTPSAAGAEAMTE